MNFLNYTQDLLLNTNFKSEVLSLNKDLAINSRNKKFTTFSLVKEKPPRESPRG